MPKASSLYNGDANATIARWRQMGIDPMTMLKVNCDGSTVFAFTTFDASLPA